MGQLFQGAEHAHPPVSAHALHDQQHRSFVSLSSVLTVGGLGRHPPDPALLAC